MPSQILLLALFWRRIYTEDNCGNCDNCLNPKKQVEAQDLLCTVIETILDCEGKFKAEYVIDVIWVKKRPKYLYKHEELEVFGSGMGR